MRNNMKRRLEKLDPPQNSDVQRLRWWRQFYGDMRKYDPEALKRLRAIVNPVIADQRNGLKRELTDAEMQAMTAIHAKFFAEQAARGKEGIASVERIPIRISQRRE